MPGLVPNGQPVRCRTWKSPRFEAEAYRKLTDVNWMAEYRLMNLKQLKLVTSAALPSLGRSEASDPA